MPATRPSWVTTVSARVVHIVGNAATAPAASGPASRLVTTAAPTITDAAPQVSDVVDQRRGDAVRGAARDHQSRRQREEPGLRTP